ncbi:hypothetical protein NL108_000057 [Boleophthalmus pectinirostris]|nr:hypothetical protein NL108_000057 [Boleophthalmus pectinirostris]
MWCCGLLQMFSSSRASCQLLYPLTTSTHNTHHTTLVLIKSPVPLRATREGRRATNTRHRHPNPETSPPHCLSVRPFREHLCRVDPPALPLKPRGRHGGGADK